MENRSYTSFDHDQFDYLNWSNSATPKIVIIAVHGINGAAQDYDNLASYLIEKRPDISILAPETRGQGNDHNTKRRGDIYRKEEWFRDLITFTRLITTRHPNAKIVWCGESMGSLIATHALQYAQQKASDLNIQQMILLAPVVSLRPHLSVWKHRLANLIYLLLPRYKVSLNLFSGENAVKVTQGSDSHDAQAVTNSYFIEKFTLRLLATLGNLISQMNIMAKNINIPIMVINGGNDYFTPPENTEEFYANIPPSAKNKHCFFPDSYHLLMYDGHREEIFSEISEWISD